MEALTLFGPPPAARVRRHDPRPAREAAAKDASGRATQVTRILRWLWEFDTITADQASRRLAAPSEQITRGEWSARIGVLIHRGLVERAGEVEDNDRRGRPRRVMAYRLTTVGRDECTRMFGGVS